jgi:2'-5' RNA ligase
LALTLDDASVAIAERAGSALASDRGFRRTRSGDLHVTLAFLGQVPQADAEREVFAPVAPRFVDAAPVELGGAVLSGFPSPARATVAILRLADRGGALGALARIALDGARRIGVAVEDRPYVPHVTLARHRAGFDLTSLAARAGPVTLGSAPRLVLFASAGGKYTALRGT